MMFGFSTSVLAMRVVLWITLLWMVLGWFLLGQDLWHFWLMYHPARLSVLLDPDVTRGMIAPLKALGWTLLYDIKVLALGWVVRVVWRRLPIPDRLVNHWAQDDELHPITGRMLVRAMRWHGRLRVQRVLWIEESGQSERYFTHKALKRRGARSLFERFPLADELNDPR